VELLPPPEHEQLRSVGLDEHRLPAVPRRPGDDAREAVEAGAEDGFLHAAPHLDATPHPDS